MQYSSLERAPNVMFKFLSEKDCSAIHHAAEQILMRTGVEVESQKALDLLKEAGALIDGDRVRIPSGLVRQALNTTPDLFVLHDRDGGSAMTLGGDRCHYGTGSDTPSTMDPETCEPVSTTYETVKRFTRFTDALPNIDFVMSMGIAKDKGQASFVAQYAAMAMESVKPIVYTAQGMEDMECIYEMMLAIHGSAEEVRARPRSMLYTEPVSPLRLTQKEVDMVIFCAEKGLPVTVPSGINAGATAPATFAGALALANAETLSALVIHQLACPGAPYMYGGNVTLMDMRTGNFPYAAPEFHMGYAAFADLARYYRMPVWGLAGASDSKVLDAQAGAEAAYELLMAQMSGNNLIHDVGYLNSGLISSMEMLLLCDEIISSVKHIAKGIEISDETLALDLIDEVGPMGQFLDSEHTTRHCRDGWAPRFFDRTQREIWLEAGKKDMAMVLNEKVLEILQSHRAPELPEDVIASLEKIIKQRVG